MVTIRRLLAAAGFGHIPAGRLLAVVTAFVLGFGMSLVKLTGVLGVGIAGAVLCLAGFAEASLLLARVGSRPWLVASPRWRRVSHPALKVA